MEQSVAIVPDRSNMQLLKQRNGRREMQNQEIIKVLQNDGFLVSTDECMDSGIELIFFSKDGCFCKVDSWVHIEGVTDSVLLVLRANQEIEYSKTLQEAQQEAMAANYDEFA